MAKERTEKSKYPSRYGGGWVSQAQYITECLCYLIAKNEKKELKDNFWKNDYWNRIFKTQIPAANQLLKTYPIEVILAALRDKRCWKLKSLRAAWCLEPILKEKKIEYDRKEKNIKTMEKTPTDKKPRSKQKNKKTTLNKLRNL